MGKRCIEEKSPLLLSTESYLLRATDSGSLCEAETDPLRDAGPRGVAMLKLCTGGAAGAEDGAVLGLTTSVPSDG